MDRSRWQAQIARVRRDNRSGAAEIAAEALGLLTDVVRGSQPDSTVSYRQWLVQISHDVIAAQPSMGVLFRLVNDMLWACHEATGSEEIREGVLSYLWSFHTQTEAALEALVASSCVHLGSYSTIMTYSRSSTVVRVLTAMAERGCKARVYCSEGRPMLEGQTLANELGWAGLDVTMGVDMALFGWLSDTRALLVGADSVSVSGLVNKIGTTQLQRRLFNHLLSSQKRLEVVTAAGADRHDQRRFMAEKVGGTVKDVEDMERRVFQRASSLDAPAYADAEDGPSIHERLTCDDADAEGLYAKKQCQAERERHIWTALKELPERDRQIVVGRHLSHKPTTLRELGEKLGVSKERVRQIETRALLRLKELISGSCNVAELLAA